MASSTREWPRFNRRLPTSESEEPNFRAMEERVSLESAAIVSTTATPQAIV
jgi:hypothetical protein